MFCGSHTAAAWQLVQWGPRTDQLNSRNLVLGYGDRVKVAQSLSSPVTRRWPKHTYRGTAAEALDEAVT